ncbi:hypothetical protein R6Q59_034656 [Mikania micrantha]
MVDPVSLKHVTKCVGYYQLVAVTGRCLVIYLECGSHYALCLFLKSGNEDGLHYWKLWRDLGFCLCRSTWCPMGANPYKRTAAAAFSRSLLGGFVTIGCLFVIWVPVVYAWQSWSAHEDDYFGTSILRLGLANIKRLLGVFGYGNLGY